MFRELFFFLAGGGRGGEGVREMGWWAERGADERGVFLSFLLLLNDGFAVGFFFGKNN